MPLATKASRATAHASDQVSLATDFCLSIKAADALQSSQVLKRQLRFLLSGVGKELPEQHARPYRSQSGLPAYYEKAWTVVMVTQQALVRSRQHGILTEWRGLQMQGQELEALRAVSPYKRIIFCGDGANDLCPSLALLPSDYVLARKVRTQHLDPCHSLSSLANAAFFHQVVQPKGASLLLTLIAVF